jgi:hypothetical protein
MALEESLDVQGHWGASGSCGGMESAIEFPEVHHLALQRFQ